MPKTGECVCFFYNTFLYVKCMTQNLARISLQQNQKVSTAYLQRKFQITHVEAKKLQENGLKPSKPVKSFRGVESKIKTL